MQFADMDQAVSTLPRERDISIFFLAQCAPSMQGDKFVFGLRMRRHIVDAIQSAQDPLASVRCTHESRVRSLPLAHD